MSQAEEDLEDTLDDLHGSQVEKGESIREIIDAVDEYISEKHKGELTYLIPENVIGIGEALVYQKYLENIFGWRIPSIDVLIASKIIYTKSIDGRFINAKTKALEVLQAHFEAIMTPPPSIGDKLMGLDKK
jgi:hypothetical protein